MSFEEIMKLAFFDKEDAYDGIQRFTRELATVVNTFATKGVREEARNYGLSHPEDMRLVGTAWVWAMDSLYHKGVGFYDGRNEIAVKRCHALFERYAQSKFKDEFEGNAQFDLLKRGMAGYTMQSMHRTLIQTATQVLFEGMCAACEGTPMMDVLGEGVRELIHMPLI